MDGHKVDRAVAAVAHEVLQEGETGGCAAVCDCGAAEARFARERVHEFLVAVERAGEDMQAPPPPPWSGSLKASSASEPAAIAAAAFSGHTFVRSGAVDQRTGTNWRAGLKPVLAWRGLYMAEYQLYAHETFEFWPASDQN